MKIEELEKGLEGKDRRFNGICHDCGTLVTVVAEVAKDGVITINGGAVYKIKQGLEESLFLKCDACFATDHTLRNWRDCEVYSRVVGYLRPVSQYNLGKKAEFEMRKEFVNIKGK